MTDYGELLALDPRSYSESALAYRNTSDLLDGAVEELMGRGSLPFENMGDVRQFISSIGCALNGLRQEIRERREFSSVIFPGQRVRMSREEARARADESIALDRGYVRA